MKKTILMAVLVFSALFVQAEVVLTMVNGAMYKHDGTTPIPVNSTLMLLCDADNDGFGDLTQATTSWTADAGDVVLARWGTMYEGSDEVAISPFNLTDGVDQNDKLMLVWYDKPYSAGDAGPGEGVYFGQFRTDVAISFSDIGWMAPADGTYALNFATINAGGDSPESAGVASYVTGGTAVNTAPAAQTQNVVTVENVALEITLLATDAENNPLTYTVVSSPSNGTLSAVVSNVVIYTPATNYQGSDSFTFNAFDGTVTGNTAEVSIAVTAAQYTLTVNDGTGGGSYTNGAVVTVVAEDKVGMAFDKWIGATQYVANATSATTTVTMPAENISLTATYTVLSYILTVDSGSGDGSYTNGAWVEIVAEAPGIGKAFDKWVGDTANVADVNAATTTLTMPASAATLTATYKNVYVLTVDNGTGDGSYTNGAQVQIVADAPAEGKAFDRWTGATQYIANVASATTTVTMPAEAITVTATYKDSYVLTVVNGTGDGAYSNLQQVAIVANAPSAGQAFAKWTGATQYVANVASASTIVTMPATNITVTATYVNVYTLTVNGGDGDGSYTNAAKVTITATPVPGKTFFKWLGATQYVAGVTSSTAVVTMPASNITLSVSNVVDITKPTVAITSPKAAQKILSNATFTVTGTAADNKVVTNVMVKLNNGDYAPAATSNRWKTWSAQVQLVAGSNTVRAYSTDSAFNNSLTSTVACTYVVCGNLMIQTNGVGTVTRAPNEKPEINKTYTLTAAAGTGSVFLNWTGDVPTSTNKVIKFVMTSNMTIKANFTDIAKPTVAITVPTALQKIYGTTGDFTVRGTALDNLALSNVMVKVNSGSFVPASPASTNGLKSWTLPVVLSSDFGGTNIIAAYSEDTTGTRSVIVTTKCVYVETGTLNITTNGPGKVTVAPTGALLLGKTYTLTAAANVGGIFSNWTGDVTSTGKVITVTLNATNKTVAVTANFTDTARPTVVITYPANNSKVMTNGLVIIRGTATDNAVLKEVNYQLYDGTWTNAASTNVFKAWTADYVPVAGLNTSKVFSVDMQGNSSATSTVVFTYIPGAVLTVQTNGNGTITPSLNGKVLQIGSTNIMTAAPKTPSVFVNWTAGIGGSVVTNGKVVKFVMTTNLVLTANFSLHAPDAVADVLAAPQAAIVVDGSTEDWANVQRSSLTKDQDVAAVINGNKVALLLTGCPFGADDTFLVAFKLRLTYGDGDNRHIVDLWTSGSALYGMMDGKAIDGLEAVLVRGVLGVQFPVAGEVPSKVTIEEVGCMMDLGTGMTEVLGATLPVAK